MLSQIISLFTRKQSKAENSGLPFTGMDGQTHYLYAMFVEPGAGYAHEIAAAAEAGLQHGKVYPVFSCFVGDWHSRISLLGQDQNPMPNLFNSVQFSFHDEAGQPVDIYHMKQFRFVD